MAKNKVIAGDYEGREVYSPMGKKISLISGKLFEKTIDLTRNNLKSWEVVTDEHIKSAASGIVRGAVGGALLGPVGLLAGVSAKNKGIYVIALEFHDGKRSLIEVDEKIHKAFMTLFF